MDGGAVLLIIVLVIVGGIVFAVSSASSARTAEEYKRKRERAEEERLKACGEVVLFFANNLGYIARQCMSRDELDELIDSGISAEDLATQLGGRIATVDAMTLGYQSIGDSRIDVKLTQDFRDRHVYVIGKSGSGKTNLLRNMILQDLRAGNGVAVIAPEQEMITEEILPYIPDDRADDVVYFNPADIECPVSFNPLHLDEGEDIDIKVDENLTIFQRVLGDTGPRMEEILRQALYVLIERPGSTLLDVERLLSPTDPELRSEIIRASSHVEQVRFWRDTYPTFPKDAHLPITNRLGRFLHARSIRNTLCGPGPSLNFGRCMDAGKIMLFNLSDGVLGELNSQLLGQLVVSKFQLAVMARAKQPKAERRNFYLYVDEFQTFVGSSGTSYEKILSRARKYKLGLTIAHQQTGQIGSALLREILGNVSTAVCFAVSREDATKFAREFVTTYDGEIINIPEQQILQLKVGQAWCKMGQHAFRMHTYLASDRPDPRRTRLIVERSRQNYGQWLELRAAVGVGQSPVPDTPLPSPAAGVLDGLDPKELF